LRFVSMLTTTFAQKSLSYANSRVFRNAGNHLCSRKSPGTKRAITPDTEQNLLKLTMPAVCMIPPNESSSRDIDLLRVRQEPPKPPDRSLPPAAHINPRNPRQGYHFMQLALVTGLFACGGLICSMLLLDSSDDLLPRRYWPRKSYGSPALAKPQRPAIAPPVPQSKTFTSNGDDKNATLQERRGDLKSSTTRRSHSHP
jgi:hypothetical protein